MKKNNFTGQALPDPSQVANMLRGLSPLRPSLGMVLGSGFQNSLGQLKVEREIPYAQVPGFAPVGVSGHAGKVVFGTFERVPVVVLKGRAHYYEGHSPEEITYSTRVLAALGVRDLLLTNAAGGINRRYRPGDFMLFTDHINWMGMNPLRGPLQAGRARFVDLSGVYDSGLAALAKKAAKRVKLNLHEGVYLAVSGPSYETPAEIRAFKALGADAVGMSTAPEAIVARQCGMAVVALSCITNLAAGRGKEPVTHSDVLASAGLRRNEMADFLRTFAQLYGRGR